MNNTPNKSYKTTCGKTIWHSRSVACVVTLFVTVAYENKTYCLVVKRGSESETEPNKMCLPCGYIDWNEDGVHGARRELFEETSIDIFELIKTNPEFNFYNGFDKTDGTGQPWYVNTNPKDDDLQNISLYYGAHLYLNSLPKVATDNNETEGEIAKIEWWDIDEFKLNSKYLKEKFAFNHEIRIKQFNDFLNSIRKYFKQ